jgi:hypothetical protein
MVEEAAMRVSSDNSTAGISGRYEFNAPAEAVFGVLTDPDRTTRWLPLGMSTESAGLDHVRVRAGSQTYEYDVSLVPEQLRVEWRSAACAGPHGAAWVRDAPAGGCVLHAEVAALAARWTERIWFTLPLRVPKIASVLVKRHDRIRGGGRRADRVG